MDTGTRDTALLEKCVTALSCGVREASTETRTRLDTSPKRTLFLYT